MSTYVRFLYEFLDQLFGGVVNAVKDFFLGVLQMFDVRAYAALIRHYSADFTGGEWFLVIVAIIVTMLLLALLIVYVASFILKVLSLDLIKEEQAEEIDNNLLIIDCGI